MKLIISLINKAYIINLVFVDYLLYWLISIDGNNTILAFILPIYNGIAIGMKEDKRMERAIISFIMGGILVPYSLIFREMPHYYTKMPEGPEYLMLLSVFFCIFSIIFAEMGYDSRIKIMRFIKKQEKAQTTSD